MPPGFDGSPATQFRCDTLLSVQRLYRCPCRLACDRCLFFSLRTDLARTTVRSTQLSSNEPTLSPSFHSLATYDPSQLIEPNRAERCLTNCRAGPVKDATSVLCSTTFRSQPVPIYPFVLTSFFEYQFATFFFVLDRTLADTRYADRVKCLPLPSGYFSCAIHGRNVLLDIGTPAPLQLVPPLSTSHLIRGTKSRFHLHFKELGMRPLTVRISRGYRDRSSAAAQPNWFGDG